jgi:hypothetical protein
VDFTGADATWRQAIREQLETSLDTLQRGFDEDFIKFREANKKSLENIIPRVIIPPGKMSTAMAQQEEEFKEAAKQYIATVQRVAKELSQTIGESFTKGFESAFTGGGLKGAFKAMLGTVLEGLGAMFEQIGINALVGLEFMQNIAIAIATFSTGVGIAAAIGLIAAGAAMKAGGSAIARNGSPSSAATTGAGAPAAPYGGSIFGGVNPLTPIMPSGASSASSVNAKPSVTLNATFFGKDDPKVQRELLEWVARAQRRGSTSG